MQFSWQKKPHLLSEISFSITIFFRREKWGFVKDQCSVFAVMRYCVCPLRLLCEFLLNVLFDGSSPNKTKGKGKSKSKIIPVLN
jgi:hypothetical protein